MTEWSRIWLLNLYPDNTWKTPKHLLRPEIPGNGREVEKGKYDCWFYNTKKLQLFKTLFGTFVLILSMHLQEAHQLE